MEIWIILGVCAAVFAMAVAVAGAYNLVPSGMPPARDPDRAGRLPQDFTAADVDSLVLTREVRGYHMGQVDDVLSRLRDRIAQQDRLLARLHAAEAAPEGETAHPVEAARRMVASPAASIVDPVQSEHAAAAAAPAGPRVVGPRAAGNAQDAAAAEHPADTGPGSRTDGPEAGPTSASGEDR